MTVSILVVDDEPDVALRFRQRFRREICESTYLMHFANSGETSLDQVSNGIEPTLIVILSDINMSGMDGLRLLAGSMKLYPRLPVMMVTAYGDDERRQRASSLGAVEFITKPIDFDLPKAWRQQLADAAA
jgi:CheY-like chemotaxis protein